MIYISLGSNLGNRINNLWLAVNLLKKRCLRDVSCSIVLETEAILPEEASVTWNKPFLNMIVSGETNLLPKELLQALKIIEYDIGRHKSYEKWAPRIIDLDILLYGDLHINEPNFTIPHPELNNRNFLQHLLSLMGVDSWRSKRPVINSFKKSFTLHPRMVGVVNVTDDSFSDGGKFHQPDKAIEQVHKLADEGASIIEIGAQSTKPGAIIHSPEQEYTKLKPVLDGLSKLMNEEIIHISIDTFWPSFALNLLEKYKINWINNVKGEFDDYTLSAIANSGCKFCFMHSISIPPSKDRIIPSNQRPTEVIIEWGKYFIERLLKLGFSLESIILDPGIGFGKSAYQNIELLRYAAELKHLGALVMIGHSRKSYIQTFSSEANASERDIETIALSLALKDKIDFLRVHNVKDHMRAFVAHDIANGGIL